MNVSGWGGVGGWVGGRGGRKGGREAIQSGEGNENELCLPLLTTH